MPELMPCPSCQATLRIPAGAEAIRCPQCKTVVNLTSKAAPAPLPVAKAIPLPPAPPKPAVPLPFDRPAAPAVPALPVAKAMAVDKPVVRGRVVREEEEDDNDDDRRPSRRDDDDGPPDYGDLVDHCRNARLSVNLLGGGAVCGGVMALCFAGFLASIAVASSVITSLYYTVIALMVLQALLFMAGFGVAIAGPLRMRPTAIVGLVVTMMHIGLTLPIVLFGVSISADLTDEAKIDKEFNVTSAIFFMGAGPSNLCGYTDIPWMLVQGELDRPWYVVFIVIGGLLEFWRASILGTLVQFYASEGKSHELGFKSLRFVYRIIWVVIIGLGAKVLILFLFRQFGGDAFIANNFRIPQTLFTDAFYLWWAFTWFSQYQTMKDVNEIITPARFADKRVSLDAF